MSSRRPSPLLRSWLPICTATTICLAVLPLAAPGTTPRYAAALAQDATKAPHAHYKKVDDILKGTPFKIVDVDTYKREIQSSQRVVTFFYSNNMVEGGSGPLAKVYQEIFRENPDSFSNLTFLALKSEPGKEGVYLSLGFEISPSTLYILNGKKIASNKGGPMTDKEHADAKILLLRNLQKLNAYRASQPK